MASRLDGGGCGRHRRVVARGSVDLCEREHGLDGEFWRGELISLEDAPAWIQYPGILTGYRRAPRTWKGCLRTVFSLHNESGNIWTHVIASVWMIELFRRIVLGKFAEPGVADPIVTFVIGAMLLAALLCYSVSTIYHLFGYLDRETYRMLYVLDQKGILASLAANHAGAISVLFEARPQLRLVLLTLSFAIFIGTQNLCVNYERSDDLDGRNRLFSFSAAWVLPTIYPLAWFLEPEIFDKFLPTLVTCFSINFMACFFFSTRWPETRFPGKFDLFLHSHQIWHTVIPFSFTLWCFGLVDVHLSTKRAMLHAATDVPPYSFLLFTAVLCTFLVGDLLPSQSQPKKLTTSSVQCL